MTKQGLFVSIAGGLVYWLVATTAHAENNVMFIVDSSGSMKKAVGSESRMEAAKRALAQALTAIPNESRLGLTLYGHRRAKDCSDIELVSPIGADSTDAIAAKIQALKPKGETPIAAAVTHALRSFGAFKGQTNRIILVTDGIEECGGDPCAAARAVKDAGLDLKVDIVGFTLDAAQRKTIQCVSDITGGVYYEAKDASALATVLGQVRQVVAQAAPSPPAEQSLLSPANGGVLVAAPNDEWKKLNDGKTERATTYNGEGVWAFKDGKPAIFDTFEVYIPGTDQYNLKEFELLAGDDGPTGEFRPIGVFSTQNLKLIQNPYQRFTFAPVTARYLKVKLNTDWGGGYIACYDFRLLGKVEEAATAATTVAGPQGIELLAPANGGALLAAPNDEWMKLNDGKSDRATTYSGEGVWAFRGEKPATFDRFEVLIPGTDKYNLKEFELLAGDDGPTGAFRSIGVFTAQNIKLMQGPYQAFTFPPVTARYLKVKLNTDWGGGYIACYDFRLFGQLDASAAPAAAPITAAKSASGMDLLAQNNGGALLAAPNDEWTKLNDGKPDRATTYSGEGIWAFKDEKPAVFDRFEVYIPGANQYNLKEFELLVSDDGPTGTFRSIGVFTTQNTKLMQSPYQAFTFAPVTARYLKVKLNTDWGGGYVACYDFRLIGQLQP